MCVTPFESDRADSDKIGQSPLDWILYSVYLSYGSHRSGKPDPRTHVLLSSLIAYRLVLLSFISSPHLGVKQTSTRITGVIVLSTASYRRIYPTLLSINSYLPHPTTPSLRVVAFSLYSVFSPGDCLPKRPLPRLLVDKTRYQTRLIIQNKQSTTYVVVCSIYINILASPSSIQSRSKADTS